MTPAGSVFLPLTFLILAAVGSQDPLAKEEMELNIWIFTKFITGIKRFFLPTLSHQMVFGVPLECADMVVLMVVCVWQEGTPFVQLWLAMKTRNLDFSCDAYEYRGG